MADIQTDFVPRDPRIAYDHLGMGDVVLFLHGIGGNRTNWRLSPFSQGFVQGCF